jgi:hypothetical protein
LAKQATDNNDAGVSKPTRDAMTVVDANGGTTNPVPDAPNDAPAACIPTQEICNGVDDNCDGIKDEGCPASLGWHTATRRDPLGTSTGGVDFSDACSNDEVLVGVTLAVSSGLAPPGPNAVVQVRGICRKFTLVVDAMKNPYEYSVQLTTSRELPPHPSSVGSQVQNLICDANQLLVGFKIAEQSFVQFGVTKDEITRMWASCAEPRLNMSTTPPSMEWHNDAEIGPVAGTDYDASKAWVTEDHVVSPAVLVSLHGASGSWVDRIGVSSSVIDVAVR